VIEWPVVLDTSVTMAWYFSDEDSPESQSTRDRVVERGAVVPAFWPLEVENTVLSGELLGRATLMDSAQFFLFLRSLKIDVDTSLVGSLGQLLPVARANRVSVYDAAFLEIASRRGFPLATTDGRMRVAAAAIGVELFDPR